MSSGSPLRRIMVRSRMAARTSGPCWSRYQRRASVSMAPGSTALTRMRGASSAAMSCVIWLRALRGAVDELAPLDVTARHRPDVDDRAAATLEQAGRRQQAQPEGDDDVELKGLLEVVGLR